MNDEPKVKVDVIAAVTLEIPPPYERYRQHLQGYSIVGAYCYWVELTDPTDQTKTQAIWAGHMVKSNLSKVYMYIREN